MLGGSIAVMKLIKALIGANNWRLGGNVQALGT